MRKIKRGLAAILAVWMLVSLLPAAALAAEETEEEPTAVEEEEPVAVEEQEESAAADEVIYNLGNLEVTVGTDTQRAASGEEPYVLFAEDGSYEIQLEENAFFPYEVQFTYEGDTWEAWFMDPNDTVTVGGHVFSVFSEQTDPSVLTQIGVMVGGEYIPAYPEEKTFTNMPAASPNSLLPLDEEYVSLNMTGYFAEELERVAVTTVLAGEAELGEGDLVVWAREDAGDDFTIIDRNGTLDLSPTSGSLYGYFDLIVGNADQLDMVHNTLYNVTVEVSREDDLVTGSAYTADGQAIPLLGDVSYTTNWLTYADGRKIAKLRMEADADGNIWDGWSEAKVKLANGAADFDALTMEVYTGHYFTREELDAAIAAGTTRNVTAEIVDGTGYLADYTNHNGCELTTRWLRDGEAVAVRPLYVDLYIPGDSWGYFYLENAEGTRVSDWGDSYEDETQGVRVHEYTALAEYAVDGAYFFSMRYYPNGTRTEDAAQYLESYVGYYQTPEEAAGQPDITAELFGDGYQADYSGGVTFSVFKKDGTLLTHDKVILLPYEPEEPVPDQVDTYFHVDGASGQGGDGYDSGEYRAWVMPADVDGYYYGYPDGELNFGCQTVFLTDGMRDPVTDTEIYPEFTVGPGVKAYAGHNGVSGTEQTSRVSAVPFTSGEAVQYSAVAGEKAVKNYWVTFVTPQDGAQLYVNAANVKATWDPDTNEPVREVYLDSFHDYHHDVFFANIGDEALKGLSVKLEDAQNVKLDEYWTIREDSVAELAAFDSTSSYSMDNIAKIRLEPIRDANGEVQAGTVSGTLVIKADMGTPDDPGDDQEVRIKLIGTAGAEKITTEDFVPGVKYVPYNSMIQTSVMGSSNGVQIRRVSGQLPEGVDLSENGKLYGVPKEYGSFTFTVEATFLASGRTERKTFTLEILQNTDTNVENATDPGYELSERLPDSIDTSEEELDQDRLMVSEGEHDQFMYVFLDGEKLREGVDYLHEEGSTRITIQAQTFKNLRSGSHTIAAEFRTDASDTNTVKRAAQNFTVYTGSSSGSSGSGGGNSKPSINAPATTPGTASGQTTADIFVDVSASDWYYPDVDWVYQRKLMVGVTSDRFAPYGYTSPAIMVTVLARMGQVDLAPYGELSYPEIPAGQWYTAAGNWAMSNDLLPRRAEIAFQEPMARGAFAVMLVKYLQTLKVDCTLPAEPIAFTDAQDMTQAENDAFQVLYQFGIFKGIGNYTMDATGITTRAQLAVLLHRLSVFVENRV